MSKHTLGPWNIQAAPHPDASTVIYSDAVVGGQPAIAQTLHGERKHDAALIAAAPELFDALKRCLAGTITWDEVDAIVAKVERGNKCEAQDKTVFRYGAFALGPSAHWPHSCTV